MYLTGDSENRWYRFRKIVGLSEAAFRAALLGDLLDAVRWSPIVSPRFRYCPVCLRFGYHARHFQMLALAACPIHRVPLLESCPSCGGVTPYYGVCGELLGQIYGCPRCSACLSGQPLLMRTFFEPPVTSEQLQDIWRPLDEWIGALDRLDLDFASLRDWITDYAGEYREERAIDALHAIATVAPLPAGRFTWKAPSLKRKSIYYREGSRSLRAGWFEGTYIEAAYTEVRRGIAKRLTQGAVSEILQRCKKERWEIAAVGPGRALTAGELAYILWRMKFENLAEPALVGVDEERPGVFIGDDMLPFPYWNLAKPAWKVMFWTAYDGYVHDIERATECDGHVWDLLRGNPLRHCCILPSTDIRGRGQGLIAYPKPKPH